MFSMKFTFDQIAHLRHPGEGLSILARSDFADAFQTIEDGNFKTAEFKTDENKNPIVEMHFRSPGNSGDAIVTIRETGLLGPLDFHCTECSAKNPESCFHRWAAFILLWQALTLEQGQIPNTSLRKTSDDLRRFLFSRESNEVYVSSPDFSDIRLDSISIFVDEPPLLGGKRISQALRQDPFEYRPVETPDDKRTPSPLLFDLPEVFRRKLSTFSKHHFNESHRQTRLAETVRYNFSHGAQISAKEILRNPLYKKVPKELLPQNKNDASVFGRWPLLLTKEKIFISQAVHEVEEIMQSLISRIAEHQPRGIIQLYLQGNEMATMAMKISSLEFDPANELEWRVDFADKKELTTEFKMINRHKQPMTFFHSYAIEPISGTVVVHPWLRELSDLQEKLATLPDPILLTSTDMPVFDVPGELSTKIILNHLRSRFIPIKISGESYTLDSHQSATEIRLDPSGSFYVQHEARPPGQKILTRKGWTSKSTLYLHTLSEGLSLILNTEARGIAATRNLTKREWDLKILKHLGILQYVFMEVMSLHFDGELTDGRIVDKDELFTALHPRIHGLLTAGAGSHFVRDVALTDLCSKSVLSCFSDFVAITFKAFEASESFYSENGEVILKGVVEREFRLIYDLLKKLAFSSSGEVFKRSRTSLLSKISTSQGEFFYSTPDNKPNLHVSLESLQGLIPYGFKIYYQDQELQELKEDEFHVDFLLHSDTDQKNYNWFELNPKFFLRGEEVDADQLLNLGGGGVIEYEGKLYLVPKKQMPSLKRLEVFWKKLQKGKIESQGRNGSDKIYRLPRNQTLELLALRASGVKLRGDHQWNKLCEFYDSLGLKDREAKIPTSIKAVLKPYQLLGVQWLSDLHELKLGALLADDMGLGKTIQTLAFLETLRTKDEMGPVIIIVPSSLIYNWQQEIEKFTPDLPFVVFSGKNPETLSRKITAKEQFVVITTYGLLTEHGDFLNQYKWSIAVFDEAQNLKNITAKRTSSARSLNAQFKICITGTPMENHYGEFYSLVDLLVPGSMSAISDFRRKFVNTELIAKDDMQELKLKIKPLLLRRTKKEILEQLPEKQETKISIAFEDRQKEIYRDIALSYNRRVQETMAVQGEASVQLQMLTALLRLRQACSDPAALPNITYDKIPPKIATLLESLQEIIESGESALVFTQFLQTLEHTAAVLKEANIPVFILHGGVPTKQRQKILTDFNELKGGAVLLMTLKTGGVGLNLTKASYVFHLEPWWNPSVENQATDRAHRIGQNKAVQVFRYIMHESLEEKIELLKDRKDKKFQTLFTDTEKDSELGKGSAALSKMDFDMLLGIK